MTIEARTCMLCQHCSVSSGWAGTDVTPGNIGHASCNKDLLPEVDLSDLVRFAQVARACPSFELMEIPLTTKEQERERQANLSQGYDCEGCAGSGFALPGKPEQFGDCRACCGMGKKLPPGDPRITGELCRGCHGRQVFTDPGRSWAPYPCRLCNGTGVQ